MIELETIRDNAMRNLQMKGDLGGIIPLEQLEDIKCGKFSQEVIESSKKSICDSLNSLKDSNIVMDNWFGVRSGEENPVTPEEMESLIKSVTKEQIIECAKSLVPHTFYFLLPQGEK